MAVAWTKHRFSGGNLALDAANTVVLRGEQTRCFDRFDDAGEIARFAAAAQGFRAKELDGRQLVAERPEAIAAKVIAIRETTDRLFRATVHSGGAMDIGLLPDFLRACAAGLDRHSGPVGLGSPVALEAALAVSALSLLSGDTARRIRICAHCGWLFVDRSRNSSRVWCDMAVCGNRQKARRHYHRRRVTETASV